MLDALVAAIPGRQKDGSPIFQFRLAPDGVCQAPRLSRAAGELLPHLFTFTDRTSRPAVWFSVALSPSRLGPPLAAVPTLWSPDFPTGPESLRVRSTVRPPPTHGDVAGVGAGVKRRDQPTEASSLSMRQNRIRWQLGQSMRLLPLRISFAICGGTDMLQPVQMSRIISTTASPPRREKICS